MSLAPPLLLRDAEDRPRAVFRAMASPWEVHVAGASGEEVQVLGAVAEQEVRRIEQKYSRYREDGIVAAINRADGRAIRVDEETARLLRYADTLWRSSAGLFDLSTGTLRRAWTFDGSDRLPDPARVDALMLLVGWGRVEWDERHLRMPAGMEIDFGGIGKEYAVDRAVAAIQTLTDRPVLVNGGGDLAANAPPSPDQPWRVGLDTGTRTQAPSLRLMRGAVATSGDAHRFLLRDGQRYGHILDPRTGWPVEQAPRSVTVLAGTCSEAGSHATLALLHGAQAEHYLDSQDLQYWVTR